MRERPHRASDKRPTRGPKTSWNPVAKQYGRLMKEENTFQSDIIFPGALRLLNPQKEEKYLDIACGEGTFAALVVKKGSEVIGIDAGSGLIRLANEKRLRGATFRVADARRVAELFPEASFDGATCILALQNIDDLPAVLRSASALLKPGAPFVMVLNHPIFRIPRQSGWGWDEQRSLQYRRIDSYLTANEIPIVANPGQGSRSAITYSYHRPLQTYFTELANAGFVIDALEEWTSHKTSDSGPKAKAENRARNEIPMFMALRAIRV